MNLPLLFHFARQDLVDRYVGSALGALWTLLLPLANILIFTLVFSRIMGARLEGLGVEHLGIYSYSVYLVIGLLAWNCFAGTVIRITNVFREKAPLIGKVRISLLSLPLYVLISEMVIYLISMSIFIIFLLIIDFQWSVHWLWWPLIFAVQQLLAYSLGLVCAVLSIFLRDIREFVTVVMQLWFWLTPIVYIITILPDRWTPLVLANPVYHLVLALRHTMLDAQPPDFFALAIIGAGGLFLLWAGVFLCRKLERDIRDFL